MATKKMRFEDAEIPQDLPEMPTGRTENEAAAESFGPSIGSPEPEKDSVSEELAGDLIALPFDAWHVITPAAEPLSSREKEAMAGPFSRILEKYGVAKIAKDEILLGFYLTAAIYGRVKAVREAARIEKMEQGKTEV